MPSAPPLACFILYVAEKKKEIIPIHYCTVSTPPEVRGRSDRGRSNDAYMMIGRFDYRIFFFLPYYCCASSDIESHGRRDAAASG